MRHGGRTTRPSEPDLGPLILRHQHDVMSNFAQRGGQLSQPKTIVQQPAAIGMPCRAGVGQTQTVCQKAPDFGGFRTQPIQRADRPTKL